MLRGSTGKVHLKQSAMPIYMNSALGTSVQILPLKNTMYFPPNINLSITDITRRFRVMDTDIETWSKEGFFPRPQWINGRKHWNSNQINQLIGGCQLTLSSSNECKAQSPGTLWRLAENAVCLLILN